MFNFIKKHKFLILLLYSCGLSSASVAGINPFNKDINLEFGPGTPWELNKTSVMKSGAATQRSSHNYYHLSINKQRLLLRLTTNDSKTEQPSTRALDNLDVHNIYINNQRLPLFQWCMDNTINANAYEILGKNTHVKDTICAVNIDRSEFTIKLDKESSALLSQAKSLSIDLKLGKYITHLTYDMKGFSQQLNALNLNRNRPAKAQVQQKPPAKVAAVVAPAKKTSLCYVRAPEQFSDKIKPISYPCNNKPLRNQAQKTIDDKILQNKLAKKAEQRRLKNKEELRIAKIENQRLQKVNREIELETAQRELKWKKMETSLWVGRCMKHWSKGTSPCYCQPYLERAPADTKDTCNKQDYNQLTQE